MGLAYLLSDVLVSGANAELALFPEREGCAVADEWYKGVALWTLHDHIEYGLKFDPHQNVSSDERCELRQSSSTAEEQRARTPLRLEEHRARPDKDQQAFARI